MNEYDERQIQAFKLMLKDKSEPDVTTEEYEKAWAICKAYEKQSELEYIQAGAVFLNSIMNNRDGGVLTRQYLIDANLAEDYDEEFDVVNKILTIHFKPKLGLKYIATKFTLTRDGCINFE